MQLSDIVSDVCESMIDMLLPFFDRRKGTNACSRAFSMANALVAMGRLSSFFCMAACASSRSSGATSHKYAAPTILFRNAVILELGNDLPHGGVAHAEFLSKGGICCQSPDRSRSRFLSPSLPYGGRRQILRSPRKRVAGRFDRPRGFCFLIPGPQGRSHSGVTKGSITCQECCGPRFPRTSETVSRTAKRVSDGAAQGTERRAVAIHESCQSIRCCSAWASAALSNIAWRSRDLASASTL